jgi:hypothetical protein
LPLKPDLFVNPTEPLLAANGTVFARHMGMFAVLMDAGSNLFAADTTEPCCEN